MFDSFITSLFTINKLLKKVVKETYENNESCVRMEEGRSGWLKQRNELRQGSALSPLLFMIVLNEMIEGVARTNEEKMEGFHAI